jgi:putative ABC transport system permease protein
MALPISYNIRSLVARWKITLLAIFGIGCVVAVFMVLLAMVSGFRTVLRATGNPNNGVVAQRGSMSELTSWVQRDPASFITADDRIARNASGQPMASCEMVVITSLPRRTNGQPANVTVRGVGQNAFDIRNGIHIVKGRNFQPGLYEVIVGQKIHDRVTGVEVGDKLRMQKRDWEVVGLFEADGSSFESEIWADFNSAGQAFGRANGGCSSLTVRLRDAAVLKGFDHDLQLNPNFQVALKPEIQYYEDQAGPVAAPLMAFAVFVAIVMGVGAVFGAMNTMYAIVAARTREVATLRALGFTRFSVLFAFVTESVFLSLIGGALGCALAMFANGYTAGTGQTASFSEIAFAFQITGVDIAAGLIFAGLMGLAGGLLPAFRAARLPISSALREA